MDSAARWIPAGAILGHGAVAARRRFEASTQATRSRSRSTTTPRSTSARQLRRSESRNGSTVAPGGINVEGDNATVNITGSGNDVDFQSNTKHGKVDIDTGGTGNDIDLNGTTTNDVSPAAGKNIHN